MLFTNLRRRPQYRFYFLISTDASLKLQGSLSSGANWRCFRSHVVRYIHANFWVTN